VTMTILDDDPERPRDGSYADLNYMPWYARMTFAERIQYLVWIIAKWEAELAARGASLTDEDERLFDRLTNKIASKLGRVRLRRIIELTDREPLNTVKCSYWAGDELRVEFRPLPLQSREQLYRAHLDSQRWKRTRLRKLVSVQWHCEHPSLHERCYRVPSPALRHARVRREHRSQSPVLTPPSGTARFVTNSNPQAK